MLKMRLAGLILSPLLVLAGASCSPPARDGAASAPIEWDGLQRVSIPGLALAYMRPGVNLARYDKVMVDPIQIEFSKARDANGGWRAGGFGIDARDREQIRKALADITYEELVDEVQNKGGYPIVGSAAPDVLQLKAAIIDLNVVAPDTMGWEHSYVLTASKGSMTLVAELHDSETDQLLARVVDRAVDDSSFRYELANSITNAEAARRVAHKWAHIARQELDLARGAGQR